MDDIQENTTNEDSIQDDKLKALERIFKIKRHLSKGSKTSHLDEDGDYRILEGIIPGQEPLIGIPTQRNHFPNDFIRSSYLKFVQRTGAKVVPINLRLPDEELGDLVSKLNGVLFPGGKTPIENEDGSLTEYSIKCKVILDKIKEMNDNGIHFPLLTIWLGYEQIIKIEAPVKGSLEKVKDWVKVTKTVTLVEDISESKMLSKMPDYLVKAIQVEKIVLFNHKWGVKPEIFESEKNLNNYMVLGTAPDADGIDFVSIYEHKKYPIYGHQYHPEKNLFTFSDKFEIPHTPNAKNLTRYYSDFFIQEAMKNSNSFGDDKIRSTYLTENNIVVLPDRSKEFVFFNDSFN